jgi:endonuclease/exonuclease/phosphatase (EEP) superfamily protein YafD
MTVALQHRALSALRCILGCLILGTLLFSCISAPVQEAHFIQGHGTSPVQKSAGECAELLLSSGDRNAGEAGLLPSEISILDWNVYKGSRTGWEEDLIRLSVGKDMVFLQEASLDPVLHKALEEGQMYWSLNNAFYHEGDATGVLLASKRPPLASCGQRTDEPLIGLPKTVVLARFALEDADEELLVANIHGINITMGTGSYEEQFWQLEAVLQKHSGPILVVGDFNNWSDGRMAVVADFAARLSLQGITFDDDDRTHFLGDPVDQVYYRGLSPVQSKVYSVQSSDHNPISVTFQFVQDSGNY